MKADLKRAGLNKADQKRADLNKADQKRADLRKAELEEAELISSDADCPLYSNRPPTMSVRPIQQLAQSSSPLKIRAD